MGQYEVACEVYDSNNPCTAQELARKLGLEPATVRDYLRVLRRKGYVAETAEGHIQPTDRTHDDLQRIRPTSLKELL